mmetsp:Transcript_27218/g.50411  ORF Transcript_27218/g.50411 Transcript_27218/m.50411 type:complete len:687 (-) Transcript_27218:294-2354(-)
MTTPRPGIGERTTAQFTQIEVSIKCRRLKRTDWLGSTDPFCVLSISDPATREEGKDSAGNRKVTRLPSERSTEIGRTEVVRGNQNPDFCKTFKTAFVFEEQQIVTVRVFNEDKRGSTDLKKHKFLGSASLSLGELMNAPGRSMKLPIGKRGCTILHAEEISPRNDELVFQFIADGLRNADGLFGKSDPYYTISKLCENGDFSCVFRSEVVRNNLSPQWMPRQISLQKLCSGDVDRPMKIEIWDYDRKRAADFLGAVDTTIRKLLESYKLNVFCDGVQRGNLLVSQATVKLVPSFLDYLSGSCRMRFTAAVDFSSSNGDPQSRESLHFIDHRGYPNEYQAAIASVGAILEDYAVEKKCFLFGYGMKEPAESSRLHAFPIGDTSGVTGVDGMLEAYQSHLENTAYVMCEPTLLAPVIRNAANAALHRAESNEQEYSILLIISDGSINDFQQTVDELCVAAEAPLSIVIVGVGDGDFSSMERLDSDDTLLVASNGKKCARDIVQFVPFRKFSHCASRLAAETLAEIPGQLAHYFSSKGIAPTPPQASAALEDSMDETSASAAIPSVSHCVVAEASPMLFVASTPLLEATAVAVDSSVESPQQYSSIVAAAASQGPLPEYVSESADGPETYSGRVDYQSTHSSGSECAASPAASWVAQKQGHKNRNNLVPGTAVLCQDQKSQSPTPKKQP